MLTDGEKETRIQENTENITKYSIHVSFAFPLIFLCLTGFYRDDLDQHRFYLTKSNLLIIFYWHWGGRGKNYLILIGRKSL